MFHHKIGWTGQDEDRLKHSSPWWGDIHQRIFQFSVEKGIDLNVCYAVGDLEHVDGYEYVMQYRQTEIPNFLKSKLG